MIGGRDETMRVVWGQPGVVHIYELKIIIIVISIQLHFTNVHYCAVL